MGRRSTAATGAVPAATKRRCVRQATAEGESRGGRATSVVRARRDVQPETATPTRVVVRPNGTYAYVTNQFTEEIGILDLDRRREVGAIAVPGHALGAALAPDAPTRLVTTNLDRLCAVSVTARCASMSSSQRAGDPAA